MTSQGWLQIGLTLLIGFLISIPVGRYLARIVTWTAKPSLDRLFDPIDNAIYLLIGRRICAPADGLEGLYAPHAGDESCHGGDHLSDPGVSGLSAAQSAALRRHGTVLAFNTAISFITNTDWQSYGGETTLSNFSQMAAITFPMFTSATTGFVVAMAFIRAFTVKDGGADLGNFYRDLIRFTTRVLMPVCLRAGSAA